MSSGSFVESLEGRWRALIGPDPDFRTRFFVASALIGVAVATAAALGNAAMGLDATQVELCTAVAAASVLALWYGKRSGRYHAVRLVTAVVFFLIVFPWMFITGGGYHSGMPAFFVFAIAYTVFMLDGRLLWIVVAGEILVYAACCVLAFQLPELITPIGSEANQMADVIFCVTVSGLALATALQVLIGLHESNVDLLDRRNRELAQADRARSEFLAVVAHELNTPLAVMQVHLEQAKRRLGADADIVATEYVDLVATETQRLSRLVSELLDLSRIDDGGLHLALREESLSAIIQEVLRAYQPLATRNGNVLELARRGANPIVRVDRERLSQVLVNLLANATRHTRDGTITVAVREVGDRAAVSVSDNGEGIPEDVLRQLFERSHYQRITGLRSSRDAGLGIGLMISRHIVAAHGGELSVSSTPGAGTTVQFTIPLATARPAT